VSRIVGPRGRRGNVLSARRGRGRRGWLRRRGNEERGATLVEFSLIIIPLAILIFGAIEFGWAYNQQQDVRFGAREGARMAAVSNINGTNTSPSAEDIVDAVCSRMDSSSSSMRVSLIASPLPSGSSTWNEVPAVIPVTKPLQQITHFFGWIFDGKTITSSITFRLEQAPTWANTTAITKSAGTISGGLPCP
jgi:Flp pilus assembly protein TadG